MVSVDSNSKSTLYLYTDDEFRVTAKYPASIYAYSEARGLFLGKTPDADKNGLPFYSLIHKDGGHVSEISTLAELNIGSYTGGQFFDNYFIFAVPRITKNDPHRLLVYDFDKDEVVSDISKELEVYAQMFGPIYLHYLIGHTLIAGWDGNYHQGIPPRLLSIDVHTRQVQELVFLDAFIAEQPLVYPHPGCNIAYSVISASNFTYDAVSGQLVCLYKTGLYWFDPATMKGRIELFHDEFLPNFLVAKTGGNLFGDHIYFSSTIRGAFIPDVLQHSLGAFNIRTGKLDWHYHFPEDYQSLGVYPPQANEHYIVAKDSESRIHIFEKQNHTL